MKTKLINKWRPLFTIMVLVVIIGLQNGCKKSSETTGPGPNQVWIETMTYNPSTITVSVNTTIVWTNKDAIAHTVTSDTGLFDSGNVAANGTYSHQFTVAGTFPYHCTIHPNMVATVVVH